MEIINRQVEKDLKERNLLNLDLGSGGKAINGYYAVDHLPLEGVDIVADLNKSLSLLPDNCVASIYSRHAFEHIENLLGLMKEIHRITVPHGKIEIIVPHFSNVYGHSDPTHVRFFGLYTMYYFVDPAQQPRKRRVPPFYTDVRFSIESISIEFYKYDLIDKLFVPILSRLVNSSLTWQNFYERRLAYLFHAQQIRYIIRPAK